MGRRSVSCSGLVGRAMSRQRLGQYLVSVGLLTAEQLEQTLQKQRDLRRRMLGELLVELNALEAQQLSHQLAAYHAAFPPGGGKPRRRFGEYLVVEGHVHSRDVEQALERQRKYRSVRVGELAVQLGFVGSEALERAARSCHHFRASLPRR